jgi:ribose/xylose/arabinose/galactoside ABC-type transport system permease subunit
MSGERAVPAGAGAAARREVDLFGFLAKFAPLIFLLVLMAVFAIVEPRFLKPLNLFNVMRQVSIYGLLAIGMTFVILTRGIDLSVGSVVALAGLGAAIVAKGGLESRFAVGTATEAAGYGWPLALVAACLIGTACGWLQGIAITKLKVPPFVVTLGGMSAFRGLALYMAGGGPISGFDEAYRWWGQGYVGPVPVPVIIFLAFAVMAHIVLTSTRYGRSVYAVGGNPEAARLSGLDVDRITTSVYVIIGFMAGLGGFVLSARLNSAEAVAGLTYELTVIASVVIGGTSLFGGIGTIFGTVVGTLLIGVLLNGLVLNNVSSYVQQIIIGVIIVLAVAFDTFAKSRRRRA